MFSIDFVTRDELTNFSDELPFPNVCITILDELLTSDSIITSPGPLQSQAIDKLRGDGNYLTVHRLLTKSITSSHDRLLSNPNGFDLDERNQVSSDSVIRWHVLKHMGSVNRNRLDHGVSHIISTASGGFLSFITPVIRGHERAASNGQSTACSSTAAVRHGIQIADPYRVQEIVLSLLLFSSKGRFITRGISAHMYC